MQKFLKELKQYRSILPKSTIKTIRGQALAGDLLGAKKGLERLKARIHGGDFSYADSSSEFKER